MNSKLLKCLILTLVFCSIPILTAVVSVFVCSRPCPILCLSAHAAEAVFYPIKNHDVRAARKIIIYGYKYKMKLLDSNGKLIKEYPIGIGKGGMGKTKEGDKKTPVGKYQIIWMASRFAKADGGYPIIDGAAFCGPDNCFTTDPNVGYSSEQLWTEGYGGNEAVVLCLDYPNASDKQKGYSGGCIEIHATHLGGIGKKSSYGCIRMKPSDARDLYNRVGIDTEVVILEK